MNEERALHLNLTEQDNEILAWSLDYVMNIGEYYTSRFRAIHGMTYWVFAQKSRYIQMSASNFLKLCDVLLTVECRLGCCGRQADACGIRYKIYDLLYLSKKKANQ